MSTLAEIQTNLHFLNTGPGQEGLIVMKLDAGSGQKHDAENEGTDDAYGHIVVVFNATKQNQIFRDEALKDLHLLLHPVLQQSDDRLLQQVTYSDDGTLSVPELTTAVFVSSPRSKDNQDQP